ncbi:MAG: DUF167 domain-containing protein [Terriglobia bacterium]
MKYPVDHRGLSLLVKVSPGAARSEIQGVENESLKVRLAAPPVDGKANEELIRILSRALGIPKSNVSIRKGHSSRRKLLQVDGLSEVDLRQFLDSLPKKD